MSDPKTRVAFTLDKKAALRKHHTEHPNMPKEVVSNSFKDLDDHIIDLYSPTDEQESDDEAVEQLPQESP